MSDFGLAQRLEIGRAEAKEMTAAYFARFPSVRAYIERTIDDARRSGYVKTLLGRRRYMPGLTSGNYMLRAAAEREATNAPLQGSAADLMKLAMVRIDRELSKTGLDATMLLADSRRTDLRSPQRSDESGCRCRPFAHGKRRDAFGAFGSNDKDRPQLVRCRKFLAIFWMRNIVETDH